MRCQHCPIKFACLIASVSMLAFSSEFASGQTLACQQTPAALYPNYSDNGPGWSPNDTAAQTQRKVAIGDIDGDGNDELVALNTLSDGSIRVEVWRWSFTVWTPLSAFPTQNITATLPNGIPTQVYLADVDGSGQKDIVIYVQGPGSTSLDQEQIYKYVPNGASNIANSNYTLLTTVAAAKSDGRSYWFKGTPNSVQDYRLRIGATFLELKKFQQGTWVSVLGDGNYIDRSFIADCPSGKCVAFSDLNGDGLTDLVYLSPNGHIAYASSSPSNGEFFSTIFASSVVTSTTGTLDPATAASWQIGDIDGDGQDEMFFKSSSSQPVSFYYFNRSNSLFEDFAPYPGAAALNGVSSYAAPYTLRVVPQTVNNLHGVAFIGLGSSSPTSGSRILRFQSDGSTRSVLGSPMLEDSFTQNGELVSAGYSGYLRFAVETGGSVMLGRGPNGFLNKVENRSTVGIPFVNANSYTSQGYPAYPATYPYEDAYRYISNQATGNENPDIRSLYNNPSQNFNDYYSLVSNLPNPGGDPYNSSIAVSVWSNAFAAVKTQTAAELTALGSVVQFYSDTHELLVNTYALNTSTLSTVTDVLNIPGQPDITTMALNDVTSILNGLGALASSASAFLQVAAAANDVVNGINAAGSLFYVFGNITQDTSTYAAPTPPNIATGEYSLQTFLNNSSVGALTANTCHEIATLSSWDQSKPLADSLEANSGLIVDNDQTRLATQQVDTQLFQLAVWQALAPTVWSIAPVSQPISGTPYAGNPNTYPFKYVAPVVCSDHYAGESPSSGIVGLVLENLATNNFPSPTALAAFFDPPPNGLGAIPPVALFDLYGWNFPIFNGDFLPFDFNAGVVVNDCEVLQTPSGLTLSSASAQAQRKNPIANAIKVSRSASVQDMASLTAKSITTGTAVGSPPNPNVALQALETLMQQMPTPIVDNTLGPRLSTDLEWAYNRLLRAIQFSHGPDEALLQLNDAITRLQIYTQLSPPAPDAAAVQQTLAKTVAIRNLLLGVCDPSGCIDTGQ